jgi:cyclophilin family peptidyl-prolyl cis-trans isomerase
MATPNIATFNTTMGSFKVELYTDAMPITCGNFIDLASKIRSASAVSFSRGISQQASFSS